MVVDPVIYSNFTANLLDAQCWRGLQGSRPEVFMHLKLGDSPAKHQHHGSAFAGMPVGLDDVERAVHFIGASRYVVEHGEGPYVEKEEPPRHRGMSGRAHFVENKALQRSSLGNRSCFDGWWYGTPNHLNRAMNEFYGVQSCFRMIEEAEQAAADGGKYDMVMFVRPDIHWGYQNFEAQYQLNRTLAVPNRALFHYGGDWFSLIPRSASNLYGNILQDYFLNPSPKGCNETRTEDLIRNNVMNDIEAKGIDVTRECCWKTTHVQRPGGALQHY